MHEREHQWTESLIADDSLLLPVRRLEAAIHQIDELAAADRNSATQTTNSYLVNILARAIVELEDIPAAQHAQASGITSALASILELVAEDVPPELRADLAGQVDAWTSFSANLSHSRPDIRFTRHLLNEVLDLKLDARTRHAVSARMCHAEAALRERIETAFIGRASRQLSTAAPISSPLPDPASLAAWVRSQTNDTGSFEVLDITALLGGRSKQSFLVTSTPTRSVPERMILRMSNPLQLQQSAIGEEFAKLSDVFAQGIAAPRPIACDPEGFVFGQPFMLLEWNRGCLIGDTFGSAFLLPELARDIAVELGRLHAMPHLQAPPPPSFDAYLDDRLKDVEERWRSIDPEPIPACEIALRWLRDPVNRPQDSLCCVHGDFSLHNILVDNGRLSSILDWETAGWGHPAEDVANILPGIAPMLDERSFLDVYRAAGGIDIDHATIRYFRVFRDMFNLSYFLMVDHVVRSGKSDDLSLVDITAYHSPRLISRLSRLMSEIYALE